MQKKIGLWIDLTNTDRYYPKEEVEKEGITYIKLNCQGADGPPTEEQITTFVRLCANFVNKRPDEIIGVHCTHGFNRSGYLICAYLVREFDWGITFAVTEFAKFRPPGIYKQDYLDRLYQLFGDPDDIVPKKPPLPDWCYDDQDVQDDDGFSNMGRPAGPAMNGPQKRSLESTSNGGGPRAKRGREFRKENPQFMEGVPNVEVVSDPQEHTRIQRKVQDMCGWEKYVHFDRC